MFQHGGQTHATCCAQQCCDLLRWHVAIVWPRLKPYKILPFSKRQLTRQEATKTALAMCSPASWLQLNYQNRNIVLLYFKNAHKNIFSLNWQKKK